MNKLEASRAVEQQPTQSEAAALDSKVKRYALQFLLTQLWIPKPNLTLFGSGFGSTNFCSDLFSDTDFKANILTQNLSKYSLSLLSCVFWNLYNRKSFPLEKKLSSCFNSFLMFLAYDYPVLFLITIALHLDFEQKKEYRYTVHGFCSMIDYDYVFST
jgi:hypothetical protein